MAGFPAELGVHVPVSVRDGVHGGPEAVGVVALVAAVTEQQLLLVVPARAELAVLLTERPVRATVNAHGHTHTHTLRAEPERRVSAARGRDSRPNEIVNMRT